jgi:hypothetical protein
MAFLDNSGDIILDAVLTDTGRMRLAKGDGTFRITQFAFGDDEINYGLYNKNHPSGSAYFDLDILQTPVLEAFTNNTSVLKYQLMSNMRNDLLFLPVALLNDNVLPFPANYNTYFVTSNQATNTAIINNSDGFLNGIGIQRVPVTVDQGLDSNQTDVTVNLRDSDPTLYETQYSIELNYNLLRLTGLSNEIMQPSSIDDDQFATYILDETNNSSMIFPIDVQSTSGVNLGNSEGTKVSGTRGSRLQFLVNVAPQVQISTEIFTRLGGTFNPNIGSLGAGTYYIDTYINVKGLTTGVSTTIPLKIVKAQ